MKSRNKALTLDEFKNLLNYPGPACHKMSRMSLTRIKNYFGKARRLQLPPKEPTVTRLKRFNADNQGTRNTLQYIKIKRKTGEILWTASLAYGGMISFIAPIGGEPVFINNDFPVVDCNKNIYWMMELHVQDGPLTSQFVYSSAQSEPIQIIFQKLV